MKMSGLPGLPMILIFLFREEGMIMEKIVFLIEEQPFGTASRAQLEMLKLAILSSIKLNINILKI